MFWFKRGRRHLEHLFVDVKTELYQMDKGRVCGHDLNVCDLRFQQCC